MENKDNLPAQEKPEDSLLKQRINNFLVSYFSYLVLALAFIIFAAGLFLFIYPQYKKISKSNELASKSMQTKYEAKDTYLNKIINLKKAYLLISDEERKKIEKMVPVNSKITDLIPEVESMVLKNSAILNSIKIEPDDSASQPKARVEAGKSQAAPAGIFNGPLPEGAKLVRIEVNLSSVNYQVLKNIMKTFENNLRLFDIAKISYAVSDNSVILIIYSYYLPG